MMQFALTLTDTGDEEIRKAILAPLVDYNASQAGPSQGRPLAVTMTDPEGHVLGGLWGYTGYEWLFTQLLVVPSNARGRGFGKKLLEMAETEAAVRGCHSAWLDTYEFQARRFYESSGYVCFGELPNYPTGYMRFFMKKSLNPDTSSESFASFVHARP